jgi:hypothetical protein
MIVMTITGYFMDSPPEYNAVLPVIYDKILPSGKRKKS